MFENVAPFLIIVPRVIRFVTGEHMPIRTSKQLIKYSKRVMKIYYRNSMLVETSLMDMELYNTIDELMEIVF